MEWVAGIVAFLQLLPRLLDLMNRLGAWMVQHEFSKYIDDLEKTIDRLEQAQTPEEKLASAKDLVTAIRNLK